MTSEAYEATAVEINTLVLEDELNGGKWASDTEATYVNIAVLARITSIVACQLERIANALEGRNQ